MNSEDCFNTDSVDTEVPSSGSDSDDMYVDHGFNLQLPCYRPQYRKGNIILLSLCGSFVEGYLWRIAVGPTQGHWLQGSVSKIAVTDQPRHPHRLGMETDWEEAERALRSAFTHNHDDRDLESFKVFPLEAVPEVNIDWSETMRTHVAFTLRGNGVLNAANRDEDLDIDDVMCRVLTSDVMHAMTYPSVHGLVWSLDRISSKDVALAVGEEYGRELVRCLIYCHDPECYQDCVDLGV